MQHVLSHSGKRKAEIGRTIHEKKNGRV